MARDIRQLALERIAALSAATTTTTSFDRSDLDRLCRGCLVVDKREVPNGVDQHATKQSGRVPMTIREFDVLLALCKAAPSVQTTQSAQRLAYQLIPYMLDAHVKLFVPSPFFRKVEPSPTEALAFHVSGSLLSLGTEFTDLQETVADNIASFINACGRAAEALASRLPEETDHVGHVDNADNANIDDAIRTATIAVSLLGFLDAASAHVDFWKAGGRLALIRKIHQLLSEPFLIAVETAFSTLRTVHAADRQVKEWKRCLHHYAAAGRPLGAMLLQRSFMWLVVSSTSMMLADVESLRQFHILDLLMDGEGLVRPTTSRSVDAGFRTVELYASIPLEMMNYLEASADFVQLGSPFQQKLSFTVKAAALTTYLNCSMLNEEAADVDLLMAWLQDCLDDPIQMADRALGPVVLRCLALACRISPNLASTVSRMLPRFIVQSFATEEIVAVASKCLAFVLQMLSQDAVISTLYTLGNVLSPGSDRPVTNGTNGVLTPDDPSLYPSGRPSTGSAISLRISGEEETAIVYGHVIDAICGIAGACNDEKITALAQSMLLQKIHKVNSNVDVEIITGAAELSLMGGQLEFRSLLKMYSRLALDGVIENKEFLLDAVARARSYMAANLHRGSTLYEIYWEHLLETIISMGDVHQSTQAKDSDVQLAARQIAQLLRPLALLMQTNDLAAHSMNDDKHSLIRDAWFNIVAHGFTTSTELGQKYLDELRVIAVHSPPLVAEQRGEQVESDIELNTVLRRGMSTEREHLQKKLLTDLVPTKTQEIRNLSYRKVIFLQAAYLVESLRADAGDCTKVLSYFLEPSMRRPEVHSTMEGVAAAVLEHYLKKSLSGTEPTFSSQYVAAQLAAVFCHCCHRIERVQQAAFTHANNIIRWVPSALCHRSSLFALLELLSLMWTSCLEAETDLYTPKSVFTSKLGKVTVELSDDYQIRRATLDVLYRKAKGWVSTVINMAPSDIKGHLQTYLSEFDDEGAYGHISLGRSFAMELGSMVPLTDQRLQSLDRIHVDGTSINTGSDLIAQYTTRQEYRYGETLSMRGNELVSFMHHGRSHSFAPSADGANAATALAHIEARILSKKTTQLDEVRDILRRAAALLCRARGDDAAVTHHLVSIPFALFTKQSIKLGTSLWLGVMNENPRLEPRLLNEIAQQWEFTIQKKLGLFSPSLGHADPFFQKAEFAPSDLEALSKRRAVVHSLLAPHQRLIQFFCSHFNATRLTSQHILKVFVRLLNVTLDVVKDFSPHPLAREIRLELVLFGLRVLRDSTTMGDVAQYRLKEKLLTAALSWFKLMPRWSYGSNMLQLKTEMRLISDVTDALNAVNFPDRPSIGNVAALQDKEQLLQLLLENEQTRLSVWVNPLNTPPNQPQPNAKLILQAVLPLVRVAWAEDAALALELAVRFHSPLVAREVRMLLRSFPERAIDDHNALSLLFGGLLPDDIGFPVLKYLLVWAPVAPVTAVTLFLPAYRHNPLVIQYAMRSLESHPIDVNFFYVPQIVQALRHDALKYVERYILEAAQVSQLFAHQIIWNMKANSYKDDDSQIPDEIKPTLDHVTNRMITSFSDADRDFFEREFTFFDEVTDISGKLKPFIQKSKPEKKQKIEEELRKIQVDVGVYLPSNPDGTVIGIDRKSGKPLQSHAKAPYMATFRISKKVTNDDGEAEAMLEEAAGSMTVAASRPQQQASLNKGQHIQIQAQNKPSQQPQQEQEQPHEQTIEVWQSAIFKVGDDCRQDVLALQMIAAFRNIFHSVGLDVYVFPYRVTATAPGCGVIDVLPNSISRDMLGREAVNGLYDYFISKYGNEDSLRFQRARSNFVKSMAAYSVISFLLQFKDRHNGNIMIDDAGHILHIDFGFCFDIAPGGIKFERAPFKLTTEMVAVMGGSADHQAFRWFEELTVKAFLAARPHAEQLAQVVQLMMDSGLPCFKPESVRHLLERFVLDRTEREAADFMRDLIHKSYSSYSTGLYDQFQLLTNGIPF